MDTPVSTKTPSREEIKPKTTLRERGDAIIREIDEALKEDK